MRRAGETLAPYRPDVLVVQEPGHDATLYNTLVAALGRDYRYRILRCPAYTAKKRIGLLVIRTPVLIDSLDVCIRGNAPDADQLFNHWGRAVLRMGAASLVVYGFKLAPRDQSDTRERQINRLAPYLKQDLAQGRSVVMAGDLNHRPFDPEYARWSQLGLVDAYDSSAQGPGFTKMDELGEHPLRPYRRIDYVWLSPDLAVRPVAAQTLAEGEFIPALPHRSWSLSDHLPVMVTVRLP